jgi:acyl carrier protein
MTPSELDPLAQRVISVIAKRQGMAPDALGIDSTFEELGFDSLDGFNIVFALEEEFHVSISDEAVRDIASVRQAVESLRPLVAETAATEEVARADGPGKSS